MISTIARAMRVEQWYKNFVIFVGLVFSLNLTNLQMLGRSIAAFTIFCILSSGVYVMNDITDIEYDRLHPKKKNRPIASRQLSIKFAWGLSLILIAASLTVAILFGRLITVVCLLYLIQNFFYTFWLKKVAIIDVILISSGFVLRAIAGTVIINVRTSPWLIICSFLLALFLALLKRKGEISTVSKAEEHRQSLGSYTQELLENFLNITVTSLLVAYMIYTFESGHIYMMATIPFAFIGIFRYMQLAAKMENDSPTFIFKDRVTQINVLIWVLVSIAALYDLPPLLLAPFFES